MKRCIIITAYNPNGFPAFAVPGPEDTVICADSGYLMAKEQGIHPDFIMGDFDSLAARSHDQPENDPYFQSTPILRVPKEKDDTDTMLCIKHGLSLELHSFLIVGGIGGRLDHTLANLHALAYVKKQGADGMLADPITRILLKNPGTTTIPKEWGCRFSLVSYSPFCRGVTIVGAKYPLTDAVLSNDNPLAISNEFAADCASVTFTEGQLLIITSFGE